jgi:glutaredoxin-related protein
MIVPVCYKIDWDKVETLEDLKNIVKALEMQVWDNHPKFETLKEYLVPKN